MPKLLKLLVIAMWLGAGWAIAHPVSFKGGVGLMFYNQPDSIDWQAVYSVTSNLAVGVDYARDTMMGQERQFVIPRINWLIHRWNGKDYQANLYVYGGYGVANVPGLTHGTIFAGGEADYETRQVYFSGKGYTLQTSSIPDSTVYQLRAGFAPYVGDFEGLNTWVIGQAQYYPGAAAEEVRVGPVLRFFYRNVLWELGTSLRGTWSFNFMLHF